MSYCRWSSDDYQCDIYCYESVDGFEIHVARARRVMDCELPPRVPFDADQMDEWMARDRVVQSWVSRAELQPIGLPHDGESFRESDPGAAADRLQFLQSLGYHVPQYAIDALREEAAEDSP